VYDFSFQASLSGHAAYVGITPERMVANIDGFLSEREWVPGGTATELEELRKEFLETIAPAYEAGKSTAHNVWTATKTDEERNSLMYTPAEDVMADAWRRVPANLPSSQANWFVEGFCYNWAQEWFAYQVSRL
jgi:hypothetical protein